ncbi:MAG: c-type cytochrome biogenesis protein CcmI [Sedimenticola sp.]
MITFWIISAVLILIAIAFLAPALLRTRQTMVLDRNQQNVVIAQERLSELEADLANGVLDQDQFQQSKLELEQALILDLSEDDEGGSKDEAPRGPGRIAMGGLALLVPALTLVIYLNLGSPHLVEPGGQDMMAGHQSGEAPSVEQMISALEERLEGNPEDAQGWFLLGRSQMAQENYPRAMQAFEKVYKLVGDEPAVLLALADAEAMSREGDLSGRPSELIRKAVKANPSDTTALWMAGIVEHRAGNLQLALQHFQLLEPRLAEEPESQARVQGFIATISEELGVAPAASPEPVASPGADAAPAKVKLRIALAPEFASQAGPEETVFVYAKALQGPRMPLAAARHKVKDLPLEIALDDSTAMMPAMRISNFPEVIVGARVSRSGNAIAESGDLVGEVSPVSVSGDGVTEIVINSRMP